MTNRRGWMSQGACSGKAIKKPKEIDKVFFQNRGRPQLVPEHRTYCVKCTVLLRCLEFAIAENLEGVWGNTTKSQRDLFPPSYVSSIVAKAKSEGWYESYPPISEITHRSRSQESIEYRVNPESQDEFLFDFESEAEEYQQKIEKIAQVSEIFLAV